MTELSLGARLYFRLSKWLVSRDRNAWRQFPVLVTIEAPMSVDTAKRDLEFAATEARMRHDENWY